MKVKKLSWDSFITFLVVVKIIMVIMKLENSSGANHF